MRNQFQINAELHLANEKLQKESQNVVEVSYLPEWDSIEVFCYSESEYIRRLVEASNMSAFRDGAKFYDYQSGKYFY